MPLTRSDDGGWQYTNPEHQGGCESTPVPLQTLRSLRVQATPVSDAQVGRPCPRDFDAVTVIAQKHWMEVSTTFRRRRTFASRNQTIQSFFPPPCSKVSNSRRLTQLIQSRGPNAQAFVHGVPETSAIWSAPSKHSNPAASLTFTCSRHRDLVRSSARLRTIQSSYRDWLIAELVLWRKRRSWGMIGAGHVYGALARRTDLIRSWPRIQQASCT